MFHVIVYTRKFNYIFTIIIYFNSLITDIGILDRHITITTDIGALINIKINT